ncbi:MAG: deoxyribonuclease IV, partial [Armatimonadetes bacterium]|nr:deoxyribonuclease IV [Armatimonadota bacterium]
DSYLINLAAPDEELRSKSIAGLTGELKRCHDYGIPLLVSHMGAHMGQGVELGLTKVAEATLQVLGQSPDDVTLLMETTAGQGTVLNSKFEELAKVLDLCKGHPRLAVCLDTCHVFAAGYDLRTPESYAESFERFSEIIGFDRLRAVHCNDSKFPLDSHKDRHEHLGEGELGPKAFQCLVNDPRMQTIPILVETPEADTHHAINVKRLWDWVQE